MNENGLFTCKLWASVCHVYQTATERKAIPDNKPHKPCLCNWCTNGSGWWRKALDWRGTNLDSDFKGLLDTYQQMRSHQTHEDRTDERNANAPPPSLPSSHPISLYLLYQQPDCHRKMNRIQIQIHADKNTHINSGGQSVFKASNQAHHWQTDLSPGKVTHTFSSPKLGLSNNIIMYCSQLQLYCDHSPCFSSCLKKKMAHHVKNTSHTFQ